MGRQSSGTQIDACDERFRLSRIGDVPSLQMASDHLIADGQAPSTETAHRFYLANGYVEDGLLAGKFGTGTSYPMSKALMAVKNP